ncbi:MAG TPA: hypothetical protein VLD62_04820 [Acidimicrobiia bacterium]|nr:hypothetical protein [Acidimicrobiia bacterium]
MAAPRFWTRFAVLLVGLWLFGMGLAFMVESNLGLGPWMVLNEGLSDLTGVSIGRMGILVGLVVLLLWIPLGERFGIGTVLNVGLVGISIDVTLALVPDIDLLGFRWVLVAGGVVVVGFATGLYVGAGLGPGPRDGLMTGIARRGIPISRARTGIEVTVLVAGFLLGGTVGAGTILFALGIGPLVGFFLPRLAVDPVVAAAARKPAVVERPA